MLVRLCTLISVVFLQACPLAKKQNSALQSSSEKEKLVFESLEFNFPFESDPKNKRSKFAKNLQLNFKKNLVKPTREDNVETSTQLVCGIGVELNFVSGPVVEFERLLYKKMFDEARVDHPRMTNEEKKFRKFLFTPSAIGTRYMTNGIIKIENGKAVKGDSLFIKDVLGTYTLRQIESLPKENGTPEKMWLFIHSSNKYAFYSHIDPKAAPLKEPLVVDLKAEESEEKIKDANVDTYCQGLLDKEIFFADPESKS